MIRFPEGPQVCDFPHEASDREIGQTREGRSFLRVDAGNRWLPSVVLNLGQFCHPKRVCGNVLCLVWENWLLETFVFIYFWLHWVFAVAARGLSLVAVSRGYSLLRCTGFPCSGVSCCRARELEKILSRCGHGLSCPSACGIFPDQGSNPCPLH